MVLISYYGLLQIIVIAIDNYAYIVPFVKSSKGIFLKTIIPSRKATREYLGGKNEGMITLCFSQPIIEEYIEVLNRLGLKDKNEIQNLTQLFAEGYNSIFTAKTPDLEVVEDDPDDNKFIECAVALDCKIIISGDKHLQDIKKYIDIDIMSPNEFYMKC